MTTAVRFDTDEDEPSPLQTLGLCDLSGLTKLGVKGRNAETWLSGQGVDVPATIYESLPLGDGGLIVRLGTDEFLLESGLTDDDNGAAALSNRLDPTEEHVYRIERQDATFLLVGPRALDVLAQTCGVNFREAAARYLVLTRVAGVSCGVFPASVGETQCYRLWVDYSYAAFLWETLEQICNDLGGRVVGAGSLFPTIL
jgi:sarcosine oxidase subunit gamma